MSTDDAAGRRRRDAADSRARLLESARTMFAERGYERATVRDIGRAADVDPALIARYFGSKAALYVEALRPAGGSATGTPADLTDPAALAGVLERFGPMGATPAMHAALRRHENEEIQEAASSVLTARLLDPFESRAVAAGLDQPRLRAEIAAAAFAGIVVSRSSEALEALTAASSDEVAEIVASVIADVLGKG